MIGEVREAVWTCIAADDGERVLPEEIGQRVLEREARFAFLNEACDWLAEQRAEGFDIDPVWAPYRYGGPAPIAMGYHGKSDSPSNAWTVRVQKHGEAAEGCRKPIPEHDYQPVGAHRYRCANCFRTITMETIQFADPIPDREEAR